MTNCWMPAIYQIKAQLLTPKVEKIHNLVQLSSLPLYYQL